MANNQNYSGVRFIRRNGRVIPIREKKSDKSNLVAGASGAVAVGGAGYAGNASLTKRVYERGDIVIDRTKHAFQPFQKVLGDKLVMKNKQGVAIGQARWYVRDVEKAPSGAKKVTASFSWLSVKPQFRGHGHAQTLTRVAAHDMKKKGVNEIFNQVVHEGSLKANSNRWDSYWKQGRTDSSGMARFEKVTKGTAEKSITWHRKFKGIGSSPIFRLTKLSKQKTVMPGIRTPYYTMGTKRKMAIGLGLAALGAATSAVSAAWD